MLPITIFSKFPVYKSYLLCYKGNLIKISLFLKKIILGFSQLTVFVQNEPIMIKLYEVMIKLYEVFQCCDNNYETDVISWPCSSYITLSSWNSVLYHTQIWHLCSSARFASTTRFRRSYNASRVTSFAPLVGRSSNAAPRVADHWATFAIWRWRKSHRLSCFLANTHPADVRYVERRDVSHPQFLVA